MTRLLTDVLGYLQTAGLVGGASGWSRAASYLPPEPDRVIVVFETGGNEPELLPDGSTELLYDEVTFQVRGRAEAFAYQALRDHLGEVYRALHGAAITADYVQVRATQAGPIQLGLDDRSRPGLTWNFTALRRRGGN